MRLIDADALVEDMKENPPSYDMGPVIYAVESAPTVSGWISVKDRLPESRMIDAHDPLDPGHCYSMSAPVLVTDGIGIAMAQFCNNECDFLSDYLPERNITHWMPLPEPPKEEEGNNP